MYFDAILCSSFWAVDRRTEFDAVTPSIMARRRAAPRRRTCRRSLCGRTTATPTPPGRDYATRSGGGQA
jgi:hypothetical protein